MSNLSKFEAVDGALDAFLRAGDFMTCADPRGYIRKSNILLDACIDAGMAYDHDDHVAWAAEFVAKELLSPCDAPAAPARFVSIAGDYWRATAAEADAVREAA